MIDLICGARPNFMKLDPVVRNLEGRLRFRIVHTGQHYDHRMSKSFFDQLELPRPDVNLGVGSASLTRQTALIMQRYEEVAAEQHPRATVVVGDVNSTVACALTAVRLGVPVVHVEAGLRSFDRSMPEEINRVLTDQISDLLLITSEEARSNLLAEGRPAESIVMVGNPMIDTLERLLPRSGEGPVEPPGEPFGLVTLHRPSNVDGRERLSATLSALGRVEDHVLVFPAHPRTLRSMEKWGLETPANVRMSGPMDYLSFINHESRAAFVITDSGGIQEETSVLGIPCVTVRPNTERPVTLTAGTNVLCPDPSRIPDVVRRQMGVVKSGRCEIPFWDGRAGARIADAVIDLVERSQLV